MPLLRSREHALFPLSAPLLAPLTVADSHTSGYFIKAAACKLSNQPAGAVLLPQSRARRRRLLPLGKDLRRKGKGRREQARSSTMAAAPPHLHLHKRMSGLGISAAPAGPPFSLAKGGEEEEEEEEEKEATDGSSGNEHEKVSPASLRAGSLQGTGMKVTSTVVLSEPAGTGLPAVAGHPSRPLGKSSPLTPTSVPTSAQTDSEEARNVARSSLAAGVQDMPASPTQRARYSPTAFLPRSPRSFFSPSRRAARPETPPTRPRSPHSSASQSGPWEGQGKTHSGAPHGIPPAYYALLRAGER